MPLITGANLSVADIISVGARSQDNHTYVHLSVTAFRSLLAATNAAAKPSWLKPAVSQLAQPPLPVGVEALTGK